MDSITQWIDKHVDDLIATYKHLHQHPELAFKEINTAAYLADELQKAGYEVQTNVGGTGVIGTLKGTRPGTVFAMRADMDALPITEQTGLSFASTMPGVMHACGHDAHSAMLLFAARAIAETKGIRRGTLKILFQPAEETLQGAKAVIHSGALEGVEEMVGLHVRNNSELPLGQACSGICHAGAWHVKAIIRGCSAHAAWPHKGVNVVNAIAACVNSVNAVHANPLVAHSAKVTQCSTGSGAVNIIPDYAELTCDVRGQTNDTLEELQHKVRHALETAVATVGASVELVELGLVPAASFDTDMMTLAQYSIAAVVGEENTLPPLLSPGSEDFHFYSSLTGIKTAFVGIGAGMTTGGHTPTMQIDLATLPIGAKIYAHLASTRLR